MPLVREMIPLVNNGLATLMGGLCVMLLASACPAAAHGSGCAAIASFSGNITAIDLSVDHRGTPTKSSEVSYQPAGGRDDLQVTVIYPFNVDLMPQIAPPSYLQARARVSPSEAGGSLVLTVGGQDFRSSEPQTLLSGVPEWRGKVSVEQVFQMSLPLVDALAAGGPGRLAYLDSRGATLVQTDLSFAPRALIQVAVDKSYPSALRFATRKAAC